MQKPNVAALHDLHDAWHPIHWLICAQVGSWRRGKVGGHDVDVIIHAPLDGPLIDARAYAFESPTGLGNELMARFFKAVDQFGPPGFLHPHRSSGGEIFGNAGGRLPKLNTKHAFCLSPKVQGAVPFPCSNQCVVFDITAAVGPPARHHFGPDGHLRPRGDRLVRQHRISEIPGRICEEGTRRQLEARPRQCINQIVAAQSRHRRDASSMA